MRQNRFFSRYEKWGFPQQENVALPTVIRVQASRIADEELLVRLRKRGARLSKIPFLPHAYAFEADFSASSTQEYLEGYYYIQETASQLPIALVQKVVSDASLIVDTCAAPGSKTTQAADMFADSQIIAMDASHSRLAALLNNVERMKAGNVITIHKDAAYVDDLGISADIVLLDAPCSGNFATDPAWMQKRELEDFGKMAVQQKTLLDAAWQILQPGGLLVYSTCSLEKEENEDVVDHFLLVQDDADLMPIDKEQLGIGADGLTETSRGALRMWPVPHGTQGFFIALLQKRM
ncbi:MAG: RsmB/NOP family class I SAM-dependent RNA methyltransferase [Nanoarchaeota archaeon]